MKNTKLCLLLILALCASLRPLRSASAPVYVTLWFDTEDYILTEDDDAAKRLAEMLTRNGVRATFKVVGEKARVLERRGRSDVIAALNRHDMGIKVYLDEADHVGVDDQPFYYGGMLNVFKMRSNLVRMPLDGGESLAQGKAAFNKVLASLRARGGGTISIYYHPNEWVQTEF